MCEQACPAGLLPQQMLWASKNRQLESAELHSINDCIECGACSFVCPSRIPLVQYFRYAKGEIRQERRDTFESDRARQRFENRQARLEREQVEKELRRKARAEAAAKALAEKKAKEGSDAPEKDDPIKAALERAAAKRAEKTETPRERSAEELKDLAEKAKAKFEKAAARLKEAEENGSDMLAALNKAAGKLEEKHRAAEKAYQEAAQKQEKPKT
jgi:electron transport complex protein RnfC